MADNFLIKYDVYHVLYGSIQTFHFCNEDFDQFDIHVQIEMNELVMLSRN